VSFRLDTAGDQLVLSQVVDGHPGLGICCHKDHLFDADNFITFLDFVKSKGVPEGQDAVDVLKALVPDGAKIIDRIIEEHAAKVMLGAAQPMQREREEFPAFEEGDDEG
jgi:hypothetical protein